MDETMPRPAETDPRLRDRWHSPAETLNLSRVASIGASSRIGKD